MTSYALRSQQHVSSPRSALAVRSRSASSPERGARPRTGRCRSRARSCGSRARASSGRRRPIRPGRPAAIPADRRTPRARGPPPVMPCVVERARGCPARSTGRTARPRARRHRASTAISSTCSSPASVSICRITSGRAPRRRAWPRRRPSASWSGRAARTRGCRAGAKRAACTTRSASIASSIIGTMTPRAPSRAPARSAVAPIPARARAARRPAPRAAASSGRIPSIAPARVLQVDHHEVRSGVRDDPRDARAYGTRTPSCRARFHHRPGASAASSRHRVSAEVDARRSSARSGDPWRTVRRRARHRSASPRDLRTAGATPSSSCPR